MKVGIITIFKSINYGAVLQATALNNVIRNMGYDAEVINYLSPNHGKMRIFRTTSNPFIIAYRVSNLPLEMILRKKFSKFREDYLKVSEKEYVSSEQIKADLGNWDKVICGSDQIWNLPSVGNDTTFMLDFIEDSSKKIAYAPSIGLSKIPDELKDIYAKNLRSFKWLSVREKTGADLIKDVSGLTAQVVLDPTLLLNKEEWLKFSSEINYKEPFIFVYTVSDTEKIWQTVEKIKKKTGYKVITANRGYKSMYKSGTTNLLSPGEFISYMSKAQIVVTNSFHGTVFAINFNKNLFVSITKNSGANVSSRITDIMEECGLTNRIIENSPNVTDILDMPDFSVANSFLDKGRKNALSYLRQSIES